MERSELRRWLRLTEPAELRPLWAQADAVRRACVGDAVHLRGLVELSNHCCRACTYCGLRALNTTLARYRLCADEVRAAATTALRLGCGTLVLQAGEDDVLTTDLVADLIRRVKRETGLAVTLSLGERTPDELAAWRAAGADRYLLRFETSHRALFDRIHPPRPGRPADRLALLGTLRELGYEVGSGVMIGIPGQTYEHLAADLELFRTLDLDMIGVGPFIAHPDTPLGRTPPPDDPAQVPATALLTYKVIALTRLLCPWTNIPATTALATLDPQHGYASALQRGANVIMPNVTPTAYRAAYDVYPGKARCPDDPATVGERLHQQIATLGRRIGTGRGDSPNALRRRASRLNSRLRRVS